MGNRSGLKSGFNATVKVNGKEVGYANDVVYDIETQGLEPGILTENMLEAAANAAVSNFGKPNHIFLGTTVLSHMGWQPNPELAPTEWANYSRISKREVAFAKLQVFLTKFGLQKHLEDPDARRADCEMATKRLKRASWARYQQRSKKKNNRA